MLSRTGNKDLPDLVSGGQFIAIYNYYIAVLASSAWGSYELIDLLHDLYNKANICSYNILLAHHCS